MYTDSHETMRDRDFVGVLRHELEMERPFALASVLATRGSMPRHASARMALLANGRWVGTIGGGRIEQIAQERCERVLAGEEPGSLEWLTHAKTGMACGGDALVGIRLVTTESLWFFRTLDQLLERDEPSLLSECWTDPEAPTLRMLGVYELSYQDPRAACDVPVWNEKKAIYSEPIGADPVAYIFGGGHVGRALTPVLSGVGFRVVVFDDREGVVVPEDFPAAERVVLGDFTKIGKTVKVTRRDFVVVTTHGHAWDIDVLQQMFDVQPIYVGCIGSRGKAAFARAELNRRGVPKGWTDRIHLPIGDDILAVTPPEIAISIAAQMIRCRAELRPEDQRPHAKSKQAARAQ